MHHSETKGRSRGDAQEGIRGEKEAGGLILLLLLFFLEHKKDSRSISIVCASTSDKKQPGKNNEYSTCKKGGKDFSFSVCDFFLAAL